MNLKTLSIILLWGVISLLVACGESRNQLPDLASISDVGTMKQTFYGFLEPIIVAENASILEQRERLLVWTEAMPNLGWWQRYRLSQLAEEYEIEQPLEDIQATLEALKLRVNTIPVDLAVAQAAKESGWGRSRFAVDHNNLFGQWCYQPGCGVIPKRRPAGAKHEVARFGSVSESVSRYMNNLNTHPSYERFRLLRAQRQQRQLPITGAALLPGLLGYSERGQVYLDELRDMMRVNQKLLSAGAKG